MVVMGRVHAPHGLKGWIKVRPYTQEMEGLLEYPDWWVGTKGQWQQYRLSESALHGSTVVARFDGFTDRESAAGLKGKDVAVPRACLPQIGEDEFYWNDLLGMEVVQRNDAKLGLIGRILETGANTVLIVEGHKEFLVPFIENVIVNVDLKARKLVVDWDPI
jgi:16S rRNA processing protein RimM